MKRRILILTSLLGSIAICGVWLVRAQEPQANPGGPELNVPHAECTYFGPQRDRFVPRSASERFRLSQMTAQVTASLGTVRADSTPEAQTALAMPSAPGGSRTFNGQAGASTGNLIDTFIFEAFKRQGVTPAATTND